MSSKEITNLVNKIVKARKIQKQKIDENVESTFEEEKQVQKMHQPLIKEIGKQADNALKAIQQNQAQLIQLEQQNSIQNLSTVSHEEGKKEKPKYDKNWIQHFYAIHRKKGKLTNLEVGLNGKLGTYGSVNMAQLFNNGELILALREKEYHIEKVTQGLLALLLLPFEDMTQSEIKPTKEDIENYRWIMIRASTIGSRNSIKYKKYLKGSEKWEAQVEEHYEKKLTNTDKKRQQELQEREEELQRMELGLPQRKLGKGCIPYKKPEELVEKLEILFGSLNAGNSSAHLKHEIRSILDELLKLDYLFPTVHKKFFIKYQL